MWIGSLAATATIALAIVLTQADAASAAEVKVWSGGAFRPVLNELGPRFERATGHKLVIEFAASPVLMRRTDAGETFDVAILLPATIDGWIKQDKVIADTRATIGRAALAVAVRAGASKPDVNSADALKRTLLDSSAVAYSPDGGAGTHFASVLERLGIAADMKAKLRPVAAGGTSPQSVAKGEATLAIALVPAILSTPGVELAGQFPSELAYYVELSAGVGTGAKASDAAKDLVKLLVSPEGIAVIKAKGFERTAP